MIRKRCLCCDSENLHQVIDLGSHPFADTFIPLSNADKGDVVYPLVCEICEHCGHVQTKYETDPLARYAQTEYSYTSSNSAYSRNHWDEYAKEVSKEVHLKPRSFVVEAGSNDGYLTEQFLKEGNRVLGVDPSPYMAELAHQRNVDTVVGLFDQKIAHEITLKHGKADLVAANNVFHHAESPLEFAKAAANLLNKEGSFVSEQPYWLANFKNGNFDQIYHEHVSYFTVRSMAALLARAGMIITSISVVDYHGKSLRVVAQRMDSGKKESEAARQMIKEEIESGIFDVKSYKKFMEEKKIQRNRFLQKVYKIKEEGYSIIAVGAAAKGNTFLNFYRLDNTVIDYVTDASPYKKGKYTPATRIPIVGDEIFSKYDKVYALILSWNIANQLKDKLQLINKNIQFIVPEE